MTPPELADALEDAARVAVSALAQRKRGGSWRVLCSYTGDAGQAREMEQHCFDHVDGFIGAREEMGRWGRCRIVDASTGEILSEYETDIEPHAPEDA